MKNSLSGYAPLHRGARVLFLRRGAWQPGRVVAVHLDPNRKPGAGRVSYDVATHPMFRPLRVAAKNVAALAGPLRPGPGGTYGPRFFRTGWV